MSIEKNRRNSIYIDAKSFLENHSGFPQNWLEEIEALYPEDDFDALDILIGHMCAPEWGGISAVRSFLSRIGVTDCEIETLISDHFDFIF